MFNRVIDKIWKRKIKSGDIDADTFREASSQMISEVQGGFGQSLSTASYRDGSLQLLQRLRRNTFTFIAFKNHSNIVQMVNALRDEKGDLRTFSQFKKAAIAIDEQYNKQWLQAEYQTARTAGKMADKWRNIEARKHILPWLEYRTQQDDKVRHEHELLHGTKKKVDDPFWDTYYPPNGWRCRCYVLQHAEGQEKDPQGYPDEKAMPPAFRNNPGKTGKVFDEKHPYFLVNKDTKETIRNAMTNIVTADFRSSTRIIGQSFSRDDISVTINKSNIKTILGKPHRDRLTRMDVLEQMDYHLSRAAFVGASKEDKGRDLIYLEWKYYRTTWEGVDFYWNFVRTPQGWKLHAITDGIKKADQTKGSANQ